MKTKRPFYKKIWFWMICAICFFAVMGSYYSYNQNHLEAAILEFNSSSDIYVHFIDVGQADCIFIDAGDTDILIDAGNRADGSLIVDYLKSLETDDLELVVATHPHEDYIGGMVEVLDNFQTSLILRPGISSIETKTSRDFELAMTEKDIKNYTPEQNEVFTFGDLKLTILSDKYKAYEETNDFSIVFRLDYFNNSFLFTGDAESPVEHDLLSSGMNIKADVLKVGHHGGATSTTALFLNKVNPEIAVISVGADNKYGHPDELITNRLSLYGVKTLRTDQLGSIVIKSDGNTLTIENNVTETVMEAPSKPPVPDVKVTITALDKKGEKVTIVNQGTDEVTMTGWYLLSTKGEQIFNFPANYILKPDQTITLVGYGLKDTGDFNFEEGNGVWNNSSDDDAKLFDNQKNLISYFDDGM
ncbi:MAG: MBL fold metallo-hydrolase [Clostridia bacterium]|nr:MBL fold metallo-hydrolase [Clostridia bacterium]